MKNTVISHLFTGNSLTMVFLDAKGSLQTKIVESSHLQWRDILKAYKARNFDLAISLSDVRAAINTNFAGTFQVTGDTVTYKGEPVSGYLFDRIVYFMREGLPYKHLVKFAENLFANPSARSRNELYTFLSHHNMPITEDGCFLAYKGVKTDFYSVTGGNIRLLKGKVNSEGQIFNGVGEEIVVDRGSVDDDATRTCSFGIHAGSFEYASSFGPNLVIVKINPRDAVAVPTDCNGQKLRTCAYTVLGQENRVLSDKKDIYYDKGTNVTQQEADYVAGFEDGFEAGWDEGWENGVDDQDNPVLNGTAETAGPKRDSKGRFCS